MELDLAGTGFLLTDPRLDDYPIVYVNDPFLEMTGYSADEVLGRNCRFLQGEDTDETAIDELRSAIADERPVTVELVNYRKDGSPFWNQVHISPVRDGDGRLVHFVGVQVDITARRAAAAAQRRSTFLADAGPLLDASLDLESTLDAVTRLSVPFLGDVCIVEEIRHDEVHRLAATGGDQRARRAARPDDPLVRAVRSGHSEIVTSDVWFDRPATAMIVPLKARGTIRGAVVFATLSPGREYGNQDLLLAEDLARRAALAIDNARLHENLSSVARSLQQGLLPQRLPSLEGMDLAARYRPAGDGSLIGGDFYDVLPHEDGLDLVIGDVTGKGARAAALTAQVRHTLRTAAQYEGSPSAVLDFVNRTLLAERGESGRYCTVAMCRMQFDGSATVCCAGHPLPMIARSSGEVEHVGQPGSVLGWVPDPNFVDVAFELGEGESFVLFTDGVTEARTTGDAYGLGGLEELLRAAAHEDAA